MLKKERYNINKFYVGELYLSHQTSYKGGNEFSDYIESIKKLSLLSFNGGIRFQKDIFSRYIDFEKNKAYEGVLTIFYKSREGYLCLHDGERYIPNDDSFCENLIPLSNLLPKIDFNIPNEISIKEAICLFDFLFKKKSKISNSSKYDINDFYIGCLTLHDGYLPNCNKINRYRYDNLALKYMLINSEATIVEKFGKEDTFYNLHDFTVYRCAFLKLPFGLYNLNCYQFYDYYFRNNSDSFTSHCGELKSMKQLLDEKNMCTSDLITIPKILKLQRNLEK